MVLKEPTGEPVVILLVEDNADHRELVLRTLSSHKVVNNVRCVEDGQAALDYLNRRDRYTDPELNPRPHVILLDLRLPKVDGLDVLQEIKNDNELRRIPVIVLTTSDADTDKTRAYDRYVNSYLVKPVDFDGFTRLLKDLGFYWMVWNKQA